MRIKILLSCILLIAVACDDNKNSDSDSFSVVVNGDGKTTEFTEFDFTYFRFFTIPLTFIGSIANNDTMLMMAYEVLPENSPIALNDTLIIMTGTFGGYQCEFANLDTLNYVDGTMTFTTFDTLKTIAASFSDGASITAASMSDSTYFQASISGSFSASIATDMVASRMFNERYQRKMTGLLKTVK